MTLVSLLDQQIGITADDLPHDYSIELRLLIAQCLVRESELRPSSLHILARSINHANWNSTFVDPYGGLISEDFTTSILSSWNSCQRKLNLPSLAIPSSSFSRDAARVYLDNMGAPGDPFDPLFTGKEQILNLLKSSRLNDLRLGAFFARIASYIPESLNFTRLNPRRKAGKFILSLGELSQPSQRCLILTEKWDRWWWCSKYLYSINNKGFNGTLWRLGAGRRPFGNI